MSFDTASLITIYLFFLKLVLLIYVTLKLIITLSEHLFFIELEPCFNQLGNSNKVPAFGLKETQLKDASVLVFIEVKLIIGLGLKK